MSRSRHSSTLYFGSPRLCSPNSSTRLPVKSLIGEIEVNASRKPSVMNQLNESFWSSMRSGISRVCGILANVKRSRFRPGGRKSMLALSTVLTTPLVSISASSAARGSVSRARRAIGRGWRARARATALPFFFAGAFGLGAFGAFGGLATFGVAVLAMRAVFGLAGVFVVSLVAIVPGFTLLLAPPMPRGGSWHQVIVRQAPALRKAGRLVDRLTIIGLARSSGGMGAAKVKRTTRY